MKFKIFNISVSLNIILTSVGFLLLFTICSFIIVGSVQSVLDDAKDRNVRVEEANKKLQEINWLKHEVSKVLNDVNGTNLVLQEYLISEDYKLESDRNETWERKIFPAINAIELRLNNDFPDELIISYNKFLDQVNKVRSTQQQAIESYNKENLPQVISYVNEIQSHLLESSAGVFAYDSKDNLRDVEYVDLWKSIRLLLIGLCGAILLIISITTFYLIRSIKQPIKKLDKQLYELSQGDFPEELQLAYREFQTPSRNLNLLSKSLASVKRFAENIGEGNFDSNDEMVFPKESQFGASLLNMQSSLKNVAIEDSVRNHVNQGLAKFSEILGNNTNNLERFGDDVIVNLVRFLNANQGAFFVVNDDNKSDSYLELVASYAYDKKKYIDKRIVLGQGLIGQSWQEGQRVYMTRVPKDYINITSGLGQSTPRCILIVPLKFNDEVHGVVELASFVKLKDYELNFVDKVAENIASALASVKVNAKTQGLLKQAEVLTHRMKIQEEEMRKNVEELRITQEESQRREEQHLREISRLKRRLEQYERNF